MGNFGRQLEKESMRLYYNDLNDQDRKRYKNAFDFYMDDKNISKINDFYSKAEDKTKKGFLSSFTDDQARETTSTTGPIVAQSTVQGGGPPLESGLEGSAETDKDTEMTKRKSKSKGKRGFRISREQGQGLNI